MTKTSTWLLDFKSNKFSQSGEDGIVEKILEQFPQRDRWCVEFGAWDGVYLSTTRNLIEHHNYSAVMIEGDPARFRELARNYSGNSRVIPLNTFVGFSSADGLDGVLGAQPIPPDFDFLCIDVDGCDYHIWQALSHFAPKLVCIEFNPTIPDEVEFVQPADFRIQQGASLSALVGLGRKKGYELVAALQFNAFFVKREYFPLFEIADNRPEILRTERESVTYLFSGYDGTMFLAGSKKLPWHNLEIRQSTVQQLPKYLRRYPHNYTRLQREMISLRKDPAAYFSGFLPRIFRYVWKRATQAGRSV